MLYECSRCTECMLRHSTVHTKQLMKICVPCACTHRKEVAVRCAATTPAKVQIHIGKTEYLCAFRTVVLAVSIDWTRICVVRSFFLFFFASFNFGSIFYVTPSEIYKEKGSGSMVLRSFHQISLMCKSHTRYPIIWIDYIIFSLIFVPFHRAASFVFGTPARIHFYIQKWFRPDFSMKYNKKNDPFARIPVYFHNFVLGLGTS